MSGEGRQDCAASGRTSQLALRDGTDAFALFEQHATRETTRVIGREREGFARVAGAQGLLHGAHERELFG